MYMGNVFIAMCEHNFMLSFSINIPTLVWMRVSLLFQV